MVKKNNNDNNTGTCDLGSVRQDTERHVQTLENVMERSRLGGCPRNRSVPPALVDSALRVLGQFAKPLLHDREHVVRRNDSFDSTEADAVVADLDEYRVEQGRQERRGVVIARVA